MKKPLFLIFVWISCNSITAQKTTTNYTQDSQPITNTGISLPQLITTNINRSNLQFRFDLSHGIKHPDLSINYEKFVSDESKQLTVSAGASMDHSFIFETGGEKRLFQVNNTALNIGADLKLFSTQNYFVQFATQNTLRKQGDFTDFDYFDTNNSVTIGVGKGRIDYTNDGASALAITEKLSKYGILLRNLSEDEYRQLVMKINDLKNRRRYVNRSYPLTEVEEIQDFLMTIGVVEKDQEILPIIEDAYKYEPIVDRTTGAQFKISAKGTYFHTNVFGGLNSKGLSGSISYMTHTPINTKWQYNKGIIGYFNIHEFQTDDIVLPLTEIEKLGIGMINNLHYIVDNRMSLSFLTTTGFNLKNRLSSHNPFVNQYFDNEGLYFNMSTQLEHRLSRTVSTTFGINLNLSRDNTNTGLNLGLKF